MPDELLMRQVPQDLTAEQSLLGAMLVDPNCIPEVIEQVRADDFYAEENKRIFETIYSMFNGAQRIDPVTVLPFHALLQGLQAPVQAALQDTHHTLPEAAWPVNPDL